ncbi:MAG TPA: DUF885 domain-containing protein [Woeseiaceae bacterium]|nr:DUF885 domain-containing protein [Woeseiaceae bacterium]
MKIATLILCSTLVLGACSKEAQPPAAAEPAAAPAQAPWADFVTGAIDEYYALNPEVAVYAGKHEYDGQASDLSLEAVEAYVEWIDETVAAASAYVDLEGIEAFERDYLVQALRSDRFYVADSGFVRNNPVSYMGKLGFGVYVDREYAPLPERLARYTTYIAEVPGMLAQMRDNLEPPLPAPYVDTAHGMFAGLADYLGNTVPGLFAGVEDAELQGRFAAANSAAVAAVEETADWLETLKADATDDFALGEAKFLKMLADTQGIDISLAELKAAGQLDLERNLAALEAACAAYAPGATVGECVLEVKAEKPAEGAVAGAERQLPMLKEFVVGHDLVSIPGTEDALVDEAPPHRRFNAAYIDIPGPFESGLPSVYYIAPPDPEWSEEDQLAYVPGEADLLAISVHEVWPGHFLQFLHANRADNRVGRHFSTYTFVEGWAHYTEEMMVEAGLAESRPEVRIGQLLNALLRNVRYLSAIGLHAGDMTVAESQALFEDKAFQDFGNATQQANRGTYDPGYLNYTLGKLMIMKLREDWTAGRGGREAWKSFHDGLLGYGSPPIPLVREQMLGAGYDGDAALLPSPTVDESTYPSPN